MERFHGVRRTLGGLAVLIGLVGLMAAGCSAAPAAAPPTLTVADAWMRPAAAGGTSAAYLTITNAGAADTLLAVHCTIAGSVMIHQTTTDASGMTGMSMLDNLPVPAGTTVSLKPGGLHVMVTGLTRPLAAGERIELQLVFEHAGSVTVAAAVRAS